MCTNDSGVFGVSSNEKTVVLPTPGAMRFYRLFNPQLTEPGRAKIESWLPKAIGSHWS